jgi:2-dehydro-3-deoxyphosphogluconate aldolase/(4S)-4-hydroxy-2-oxoglutarate aldolase
MPIPEQFARLAEAAIIAVVRADRPEDAVRVAGALLEGDVGAIELTFTTPGAASALAEARRVYGDRVLLGAGTIRELEQVAQAVQAGAQYLVTPHLRPDLLDAMLATGLPCLPGVLTPSEVAAALDRGADVVKLFPADTVGTGYLKALRGPFPGLQVVPTGGITLDNIGDWLQAGALAVGVGGELVARQIMQAGKWEEITRRAERFVAAARRGRQP